MKRKEKRLSRGGCARARTNPSAYPGLVGQSRSLGFGTASWRCFENRGWAPDEAKNGSQRVGVLVPPCSILLQICFKNIIEALNVNSFRLIKFSNILRCDILVFRFAGFGGFVFVVSSLRAGSLWGQKVRKSEYFLVFVI